MKWLKDYEEDILNLSITEYDFHFDLENEEQWKYFMNLSMKIFSPLKDGILDPGDMDRIFQLYWENFKVALILAARKQIPIQLRLTKLYEKLENASDEELTEYARMLLRSRLQAPQLQSFFKRIGGEMSKSESLREEYTSLQLISLIIKLLPEKYDKLAPDGSEIRLLAETDLGGLAHCTLPEAGTSKSVKHKTVEESWLFLSGKGEVWQRKLDGSEKIEEVTQGTSITIPTGTSFQFRNTGNEALCFFIITMPPWPGDDEAISTEGKW